MTPPTLHPPRTPPRPRVLILSAYYFPWQGGSETHAREVATYLAAQGFSVLIVTKRLESGGAASAEVDGIPVQRVAPGGPRTGWRKWLMLPFAAWAIVRRRSDFDLIYCPGYQGIGIAAIFAGGLLGKPVVLRSGNLGVLEGGNWDQPLARWGLSPGAGLVRWGKHRLRNFYMRANAFVCNCREIEREASACGVPRDRIHYIPNAVDITRYREPEPGERQRIREAERWPANAFLCLYVGRLSAEKGVLDLLEAWRQIDRDDAVLVLVGPDMTGNPLDAGPAARAFVSTHQLERRVIFHGESRDVARLFRAADAYAQPSHYEAFSNAVIEAMATGLPLVASAVGGMLDCVVDEHNGLLCPPREPAALARQLRRLMDSPDLARRLGAQARATVVADFEKEATLRKFRDLFEGVARRSPVAAPGSRGANARA